MAKPGGRTAVLVHNNKFSSPSPAKTRGRSTSHPTPASPQTDGKLDRQDFDQTPTHSSHATTTSTSTSTPPTTTTTTTTTSAEGEEVVAEGGDGEFDEIAPSGGYVKTDIIAQKVQQLRKERGALPVDLIPTREAGVYKFGNKVLHLSVHQDTLVVRVGGGFVTIDEYLDKNEFLEGRKALRGLTHEQLLNEAKRLQESVFNQEKKYKALKKELQLLKDKYAKDLAEVEEVRKESRQWKEREAALTEQVKKVAQEREKDKAEVGARETEITSRVATLQSELEKAKEDHKQISEQQRQAHLAELGAAKAELENERARVAAERESERVQLATERALERQRADEERERVAAERNAEAAAHREEIESLRKQMEEDRMRAQRQMEQDRAEFQLRLERAEQERLQQQKAFEEQQAKMKESFELLLQQQLQELENKKKEITDNRDESNKIISELRDSHNQLMQDMAGLKDKLEKEKGDNKKLRNRDTMGHQVTTQKVKEYLATNKGKLPCPLVEGDKPGTYLFGLRTINLTVLDGSLMVRVGGGFVTMDTFIEKYGRAEARKMHKQAVLSGSDEKAVIKNLGVSRMIKMRGDAGQATPIQKEGDLDFDETLLEDSPPRPQLQTPQTPQSQGASPSAVTPQTPASPQPKVQVAQRTLVLTAKTKSPATPTGTEMPGLDALKIPDNPQSKPLAQRMLVLTAKTKSPATPTGTKMPGLDALDRPRSNSGGRASQIPVTTRRSSSLSSMRSPSTPKQMVSPSRIPFKSNLPLPSPGRAGTSSAGAAAAAAGSAVARDGSPPPEYPSETS